MSTESQRSSLLNSKTFIKILLGHLAYFVSFWPSLCVLIHKIRGVRIKNLSKTYIGYHALIDNVYPELITIDENCIIESNVLIFAHFKPSPPLQKYYGEVKKQAVNIHKGTYIGSSAIILPGVTVGENCIIYPGAVVTHDLPPNTIVAGNPAKKLKI
ncbi:MAG: acyltransferase [Elusimicrobia bacterium]|nr:acyltransferase [Elusimicrobiota bacterium]